MLDYYIRKLINFIIYYYCLVSNLAQTVKIMHSYKKCVF